MLNKAYTLLVALFLSSSLNAATLNVVGGQLMGAYDVDVNGTLYDVSFQDGSCDSLFNGCTEFTFNTLQGPGDASTALMTQVFLGDFDTIPSLTNGIEGTVGAIITPYSLEGILVDVSFLYNRDESLELDQVSGLSFRRDLDLTIEEDATWAVWSTASEVPIPAAGWLFISALACLAGKKRLSR